MAMKLCLHLKTTNNLMSGISKTYSNPNLSGQKGEITSVPRFTGPFLTPVTQFYPIYTWTASNLQVEVKILRCFIFRLTISPDNNSCHIPTLPIGLVED